MLLAGNAIQLQLAGNFMRPMRCRLIAAVTVAFLCSPTAAQPINPYEPDPRPEAYAADNEATLAPAGQLEIDGRRMTCGPFPTVLDPHHIDFGGAYRGFVILNPNLFAGLATPVKLWIFSHECAHQSVGQDEVKADCVAVQRGKREGWLNAAGLAQICEFMQPARADRSHFSGGQRCELMRQCFAQKDPKRPAGQAVKRP
jgi:hypothetical protein